MCSAPYSSTLFPFLCLHFFSHLPPSSSSSSSLQHKRLYLNFVSYLLLLCYRTLGMMAPCTSPRWQPSTWETTVAMPTAMKTSIRHMCCRWMVSSGSFLTYTVDKTLMFCLYCCVILQRNLYFFSFFSGVQVQWPDQLALEKTFLFWLPNKTLKHKTVNILSGS